MTSAEPRRPCLRGHPAGLRVRKCGAHRQRNVLVGLIGQALTSPTDWPDGPDPDGAINTILQATRLLPPQDLEMALSAWDGLEVAREWVPGRNAAGEWDPRLLRSYYGNRTLERSITNCSEYGVVEMYTLPLIAQKGGMGKTALAIKRTEAAEALGLRMARPSATAGRSRVLGAFP